MAEKRKRAQWGEGRVAYLALAPEIAKALEQGLPMTRVFAMFADRLGMSYRQFIRYANPASGKKEKTYDRSPRRTAKPPRIEAADSRGPTSLAAGDDRGRGFHFDPADIDGKTVTGAEKLTQRAT